MHNKHIWPSADSSSCEALVWFVCGLSHYCTHQLDTLMVILAAVGGAAAAVVAGAQNLLMIIIMLVMVLVIVSLLLSVRCCNW